MRIRAYGDGDLDAVAAVFTAAVHGLAVAQYDATQRDAWAPRPPDLGAWRQRLAGVRTLVAEADDGELAGFVGYRDDGHIDLLFVAPAHAGCGVAARLYAAAEAALRARGVGELTTDASLVARPFFERRGFRVIEEQEVVRAGVVLRRTAMRKSLTAVPPDA